MITERTDCDICNKIGDALVLCDAGGGTVDLISYEIMNLNPLEVKELVRGTGRLGKLSICPLASLN